MAEFTLHLQMGNAAMQTPEDIARELKAIAEQIVETPVADGTVTDYNGNSVGSFHMELPEPPFEMTKACELEAGQMVKLGDESDFLRLEINPAPMPGGRVELIFEPYSEGFLVDAALEVPMRDEEAV